MVYYGTAYLWITVIKDNEEVVFGKEINISEELVLNFDDGENIEVQLKDKGWDMVE